MGADSIYIQAGGDIGSSTVTAAGGQARTGRALDDWVNDGVHTPMTILSLGDHAYQSGTLTEFNSRFNPFWGTGSTIGTYTWKNKKSLLRPITGNHEWADPASSTRPAGYESYFGAAVAAAASRWRWSIQPVAPDGNKYWRIIGMDSEKDSSAAAALSYLTAELNASKTAGPGGGNQHIICCWHHPLWTPGGYGNFPMMADFMNILQSTSYNGVIRVALSGHDHVYARTNALRLSGTTTKVAATDSTGVTSFVLGNGGNSPDEIGSSTSGYAYTYGSGDATHTNFESWHRADGILRAELTATSFIGHYRRATSSSTFVSDDTYTLGPLTLSGAGAPPAGTNTLTGFTPTSGAVGATVTITGSNFTGATEVRFGGATQLATTWSIVNDTTITATVPSVAITGTIRVKFADTTVIASADTFTVTTVPSAATVTSFTPTSGAVGATITVTGTNLVGATNVYVGTTSTGAGGIPAITYNVMSETSMTFVIPGGAVTGWFQVRNPDGNAISPQQLTVTTTSTTAPIIDSISPTSGTTDSIIAVTGSRFGGTGGTGTPTGVALGHWTGANAFRSGDDVAVNAAYEADVGTTFDGLRWRGQHGQFDYVGWTTNTHGGYSNVVAKPTGTTPTSATWEKGPFENKAQAITKAQAGYMISTKLNPKAGSGGARYPVLLQDVLDGSYDDLLTYYGNEFKDVQNAAPNCVIVVELAHEVTCCGPAGTTGDAQPHIPDSPLDTPDGAGNSTLSRTRWADWVRYIREWWEGMGVRRVVYCVGFAGGAYVGASPTADRFLTPDSQVTAGRKGSLNYVDVVALDRYSKTVAPVDMNDWTPMVQYGQSVGKPSGIIEIGCQPGGGNGASYGGVVYNSKGNFYRQAKRFAELNVGDLMFMFFNTSSDGLGGWPPEDDTTNDGISSGAFVGFREMAQATWFKKPLDANNKPQIPLPASFGSVTTSITDATVNGVAANFTFISASQINVDVPGTATGTGRVTLTNSAGETTTSAQDFVVTPASGVDGTAGFVMWVD